MMKLMKANGFSFCTIVLLLCVLQVNAQVEQLVPLKSNPAIKKYILQGNPATAKSLAVGDTIDLPIVDDFSTTQVYPDQQNWADQDVYVNSQLARNPVTIGVATFDGLDDQGNPYDNSGPSVQGGCDTLTSKYIRLLTRPSGLGGGQYSLADSITLSFFWQKKGWGDAPDSNDSLVVDFFNGTSWSRQWFIKGGIANGQDTVFTQAQIRITNAAFLVDGFRFRIRNYGSRTGLLDQWHIDYVRLYKAYNQFSGQMDTTLSDVAMTLPGGSLLTEYTSVPWDHFISLSSNDQLNMIKDSATMYYRVNDVTPADVGFNSRIYDFAGTQVSSFGATNGNIFPGRPNNQNLTYTFPLANLFPNSPSLLPDSTFFSAKSFFSNGNAFGGLKSNDTVTHIQEFYNYYSLDDGSAEVGYDLVNAPNGKVAMKFEILKPDTLRAIRIHFVQQGANVSNKLFILKVWSSLSPEVVLYQETSQRPVYIDEINGYATYVLDQIVPVSGTIYVGFQQILGDGLHLGYDRNTASNSRMYYNVGGGFIQTLIANGSYMIRPVMGDTNLFVGIAEPGSVADFSLTPNPASNEVRIDIAQPNTIAAVMLFSATGELIRKENFKSVLDIASLPSGMYFVCLQSQAGQVSQRRLIIAR